MSAPTVRPALSLADIELLLAGLEHEGMAATDIDRLKDTTDLAARLERAARPLRRASTSGGAS
jgi:hypothetical protein